MPTEKRREPRGSPCRAPLDEVAPSVSVADNEIRLGAVSPPPRPVKDLGMLPQTIRDISSIQRVEGVGVVETRDMRIP